MQIVENNSFVLSSKKKATAATETQKYADDKMRAEGWKDVNDDDVFECLVLFDWIDVSKR